MTIRILQLLAVICTKKNFLPSLQSYYLFIKSFCKRLTSRKLFSLPLLIIMININCGYHLSGKGSFLPSYIKKIAIPTFKNNTPRYQLDQRLTRAVIDVLIKRGKYQILSNENEGDALLQVDINSFNYIPVQFTQQGRANRYEIIIVAKVAFKDKVQNKTIFENPAFTFRSQYDIPEGADITYFDKETIAIEDISKNFAETLVSAILEAF